MRRCAAATFTAYAPACSCGWRGPAQPVTDIAHVACARSWLRGHVAHLPPALRSEHRSVPCAELGRLITGY